MLKQMQGLVGRANRTLGFRPLVGSSGRSSLQLNGGLHINGLRSIATPSITHEIDRVVAYRRFGASGNGCSRKYSIGSTRCGPSDLQTALSNEIMEETANDEVDSELEIIQKQIMKDFTLEETAGSGVVT